MKIALFLLMFLTSLFRDCEAQEDEVVLVKARLERSNEIQFALASCSSLGQNNYTGGNKVGLGYLKRLNRVLSIGGNISYTTFRTDYADFMTGKYFDARWNNAQPNNFYFPSNMSEYYLVNLSGGELNQIHFLIPFMFNFIPIKSSTITSFYASISPGVILSKIGQVLGNENYFQHPTIDQYIQVNNRSFEAARKQSKLTGGMMLNLGVDFFPTHVFSFSFQVGYGYSLPVPFVDTSLYQSHTIEEYRDEKFPLSVNKGLSTASFQFGLSYNF